MGGDLSASASSRPCRSRQPRGIPRRTSPSTRSAARRSWPIPDWRGGRYIDAARSPRKGLAVARMAAHITYLSEQALHRKFGRKLQDRACADLLLRRRFPGRELPAPPGPIFVERFDANSYLYHDPRDGLFRSRRRLRRRARRTPSAARKTRFCVVSFTSDWLFPTSDSRAIVHALNAGGASVSSSRSRPTRATTPSCSTCRNCIATSRGFLDARRARHRARG